MTSVLIERLSYSNEGIFGRLTMPGLTLVTGELPWRDNLTNRSAIPEGIYACIKTYSPRFRRTLYLVTGIVGRSGIRFHAANFCGDISLGYHAELNGCITLGEVLGSLRGQRAVLLSAPAIRRFHEALKDQPFQLEIRNGTALCGPD